MVSRYLKGQIQGLLLPGKVNILLGARRVGKTSLMQKISDDFDGAVLWLDGDLATTRDILGHQNLDRYRQLIGHAELVIIDEAQDVDDIGKVLKIMVDHMPEVAFLASGSSPFDLANKTGEPLVGRAHWHYMYPLAQMELSNHETLIQTTERLEERLIYGSYPEVYTTNGYDLKSRYLKELSSSYLLKDILNYEGIRNSSKINNLLKLIAYQIGHEVSIQELGRQIGMSKNTVDKYLDLLEKVFVIKKISGFSRNLRKEVSKNARFYFWDNGIRNAIINDFRSIDERQDIGDLWENYLITERLKKLQYLQNSSQLYFWRTYDQQEIDCVETLHDNISGYEYKWRKKKAKIPKAFAKAYPAASFEVVNRENFLDYIG